MRTNVYVDGFNLYYGAVKDSPYKWLDLGKLCSLLLPKHSINRIRYFTALVSPRSSDPQQPQRQQTCIRALKTISNLTVHFGEFYTHPKRLPLVNPLPNGPRTVEVLVTEEKGSDVNLATLLIVDGILKDYEVAVIVSIHSDLPLPMDFVRSTLKLPVGVLNPHQRQSRALSKVTTFYKRIRKGVLATCQFPPT